MPKMFLYLSRQDLCLKLYLIASKCSLAFNKSKLQSRVHCVQRLQIVQREQRVKRVRHLAARSLASFGTPCRII